MPCTMDVSEGCSPVAGVATGMACGDTAACGDVGIGGGLMACGGPPPGDCGGATPPWDGGGADATGARGST